MDECDWTRRFRIAQWERDSRLVLFDHIAHLTDLLPKAYRDAMLAQACGNIELAAVISVQLWAVHCALSRLIREKDALPPLSFEPGRIHYILTPP